MYRPFTNLIFSGERYKQSVRQGFFVRFHMMLILTGIGLSGVGINKLLLELGVNSMPVRYPIAICISYLIFFLLIRLWIWYISIAQNRISSKQSHDSDFEKLDLATEPIEGAFGHAEGQDWGYGESGASDRLADATTTMSTSQGGGEFSIAHSPPSPGGSSSSILDGLSGIDGGDEGGFLLVILLVILGLLLFAIFGAGIYVIYQAPAILSEAALHAILASSLLGATKHFERRHWAGSVFKATWIPFVTILLLAISFGAIAGHYCPEAIKAADVFTHCSNPK